MPRTQLAPYYLRPLAYPNPAGQTGAWGDTRTFTPPRRPPPPTHRPQWSTAKKVAVGVGGAAVAVIAVMLLWPSSEAKAEGTTVFPTGPVAPPKGYDRPAGDPPPQGHSCFPKSAGGSGTYDETFWEQGGTTEARKRVLQTFRDLGYATPTKPDGTPAETMNDPGADGVLGGGDDQKNSEVERFQREYNQVSRKTAKSGFFVASSAKMGGLDPDGLVGPCTLNGMKFVLDHLQGREWPDIVAQAKAQA